MSSVHRKPSRAANGKGRVSFEVRFRFLGQPLSYYPGASVNKKTAAAIGAKLDALVSSIENSDTLPPSVAEWVSGLPDKQHEKLASWGLVQPRRKQTETPPEHQLGKWTADYIARGKRKESTNNQLQFAADNLVAFFGAERPITDITAADAEDFRIYLETKGRVVAKDTKPRGLAQNTVRRRIGRSREFFNLAVKRKLIASNPFADEKTTVNGNPDRQVFVPAEWIEKIIATIGRGWDGMRFSDSYREDWRIMFALARYGGLRSHETRLLRWADIDLANRRMVVRSDKNPPERVCPIFPELMPHLLRAREMAPQGAELVVQNYGPKDGLNETAPKIIRRAGLEPWAKPFQNLRATRETELLALYPTKDVVSWLGNSAPVAMKHYAMTMQESFERATREGACGVLSKTPLLAPHKAAIRGNQGQSSEGGEGEETPENTGFCLPELASDKGVNTPTRVHTIAENTGKTATKSRNTPLSTPTANAAQIIAAIRSLNDAERAALLSLLSGETESDEVQHARKKPR